MLEARAQLLVVADQGVEPFRILPLHRRVKRLRRELQKLEEVLHTPVVALVVLELDLIGSVQGLRASVAGVQSGDMRQADAMLVAQANTLDSVFDECLRMWLANQFTNHGPFQDYLRMAMKAQSQAGATWESLSKIKNPMGATFVRQANIADGPQQLDNGGEPSRTANIENQPNELLESGHGERLDTGAAARQAAAIQRWKPWERSTGPRSEAGKEAASGNAGKGGTRQLMRALSAALSEQRGSWMIWMGDALLTGFNSGQKFPWLAEKGV